MGQILKSVSAAYGGYSIARDEKVVLIKGAIPGEVVEVEITEKRRDYSIAEVTGVVEPSEFRVDPPCPVFGKCGGCQLQYIAYEKQVAMKEEVLLDSLTRLGKLETALAPAMTDAQWNYRQRGQFKISPTGEAGFFREASRDVVSFDSCPLMSDEINSIFRKIRDKGLLTGLSEIHISGGDTPVALLKGRDYDGALFEDFIEAGLSGVAYNDTIAYGGAYTGFDLNGFRYTVAPWTFFQSHWRLNTKVAALIVEELTPFLPGKRVLDLYAGAGNFSIPLSAYAAGIIAVEENPYAVDDGKRNLELNNISNCRIVKSSAEKYRMTTGTDLIILDPPRPGLTSSVMAKVLEAAPSTIVYISCNPATLARDLRKLKDKYEVRSVRLIDFFPNTYHIEAVAFLQIR